MTRAGLSRGLRTAAVAALVATYPFLLVTGLGHASTRTIAALLLALTLAAVLLTRQTRSDLLPLLLRRFGLLVAVTLVAAATNHPFALTLLPSLTSLWLLATFGATLRRGPSIVEQFAVARHDAFPDFLLPYCRKVTVLWCVFFALNAVAGIALAVAAPPEVWAFYTGVLAYLLVVAVALAEYGFRKCRFRFYDGGVADGLWRRLCPPERTVLGRRTLEWQLASARRAQSGAR